MTEQSKRNLRNGIVWLIMIAILFVGVASSSAAFNTHEGFYIVCGVLNIISAITGNIVLFKKYVQ